MEKPSPEAVQGAIEVLRPETEIEPLRVERDIAVYSGIAQRTFTEKQISILTAPVDPGAVSWKPSMRDGPADPQEWQQAKGKKNQGGRPWRPPLAYAEQVQYRRRLNAAFGPGGWGMRLLSPPKVIDNTVVFHGGLYAEGRFVSEAFGEQDYFETNGNMSWATALESAKSDCLTRCCKDLGMFSELWESRFLDGLLDHHTGPAPAPQKAQDEQRTDLGIKIIPKSNPAPPAPKAEPKRLKGSESAKWMPPYPWIQYLEVLHAHVQPEQRQLSIDWLYATAHRNQEDWWRQTQRLMDTLRNAGQDFPTPPHEVQKAGIEAVETDEVKP